MSSLMGSLVQHKTGHRWTLGSRTLVGRSRNCDLCLPHRSISGEHAVIWWDGAAWCLRDLGSRNGTLVDGGRLDPHVSTPLREGARLEFGAHPLGWVVESVGPPVPRAHRLSDPDAVVEAEDGMLALPDDDAPEVVVYSDQRVGWILERAGAIREVNDLDVVEVAGADWRLQLPHKVIATDPIDPATPQLRQLSLRFEVSADEEHVAITAVTERGLEIDLGSRTHHYMLLSLARLRLADAALPEASQGWVHHEDFCHQLRIDRERLNMFVFRARKQLAAADIGDAHGLIERRVDTHQLRIGVGSLSVDAGR